MRVEKSVTVVPTVEVGDTLSSSDCLPYMYVVEGENVLKNDDASLRTEV